MIRHGFEALSFERVEASTDAPNAASVAVMERAGMAFWKRERTNGLDTIYYAITKSGGSGGPGGSGRSGGPGGPGGPGGGG
jgi:RimJ/RimL family protein N-acetyltransferase